MSSGMRCEAVETADEGLGGTCSAATAALAALAVTSASAALRSYRFTSARACASNAALAGAGAGAPPAAVAAAPPPPPRDAGVAWRCCLVRILRCSASSRVAALMVGLGSGGREVGAWKRRT